MNVGLARTDVHEGMEVRVFSENEQRRRGHGSDGIPGTITKVGRTLVTVQTGKVAHVVDKYRLDTQQVNGDYGSHHWFRTMDQMAVINREQKARSVLKDHRLSTEHGSDVTVDQLERIAAILDPSFVSAGIYMLVNDGGRKIHCIKAIRLYSGFGLYEAKTLLDTLPAALPVLDVRATAAMVAELRGLGATVEVT